jgi:hypothetical protein
MISLWMIIEISKTYWKYCQQRSEISNESVLKFDYISQQSTNIAQKNDKQRNFSSFLITLYLCKRGNDRTKNYLREFRDNIHGWIY